jgi:hypothetical protein
LALHAVLRVKSEPGDCPVDAPAQPDECFARTGTGVVPGLGSVSEVYTFAVQKDRDGCLGGDILLASTGRLVVAGKGEIFVSASALPRCFVPAAAVLKASRPFTVTGGSGIYAGASGTGTLQHDIHAGPVGGAGYDTWVGTLEVPALEFDVTPPTLAGAVARTVRTPSGKRRARVVYKVTAHDEVDGALQVTCVPGSGSFFRVGRTVVSCAASDTSGNVTKRTFTVRVVARR